MTAPRPRVGDQIETAERLRDCYAGDVFRDAEGYVWLIDGKTDCFYLAEDGADETIPDDDVPLPLTVLYAQPRTSEPAPEPYVHCERCGGDCIGAFAHRTPEPAPATVEDAYRLAYDVIRHHPGVWYDSLRAALERLAAVGLLRTPILLQHLVDEQIEAAAHVVRESVDPALEAYGFEDYRNIVREVFRTAGVPVEGSQG